MYGQGFKVFQSWRESESVQRKEVYYALSFLFSKLSKSSRIAVYNASSLFSWKISKRKTIPNLPSPPRPTWLHCSIPFPSFPFLDHRQRQLLWLHLMVSITNYTPPLWLFLYDCFWEKDKSPFAHLNRSFENICSSKTTFRIRLLTPLVFHFVSHFLLHLHTIPLS